jgi:predicted enzyme related to lactoylglutathione lyase
MTHIPGKFVWFELFTPDVDRSLAFWSELVGWKRETMPMQSGDVYVMLGNSGMMQCGVMSTAMLPPGTPPHWLSYLSVHDVGATARAAEAHGGQVLKEPWDIPTVGRIGVIQDSNGGVLGLFRGEGDDPADAPSVHGLWHWNELWATDAPVALAFYEKVVGYVHEKMSMGEGDYHVLIKEGTPRGGLMQSPVPDAPASWVPFLHVDAVDEVVERARAHRAEVKAGPMEIPTVGRFAVITDDVGALVGLITPAARG